MTYVWIEDTSGKKRYVNDDFLNPCRECGEKISVCQANNCTDGVDEPEDNGCQTCDSDRGCQCDSMYEAYKEMLLD